MRFLHTISVAVTALISTAAAVGDCDQGPFETKGVGYGGGGEWCETRWKDGAIITGIEVWADGSNLNAIRFYYSDGVVSRTYGKSGEDMNVDESRYKKITWDPLNDKVTAVSMWGEFEKKAVGKVEINTKGNQRLKVGWTGTKDGQPEYQQPIGTGILLGAWGREGFNLDALGFLFMKGKEAHFDIEDVKLKVGNEEKTLAQLKQQKAGIQPMAVDTQEFHNQGTTVLKEKWGVKRSEKKRTKVAIEKTSAWGKSVNVGVSGGFPLFSASVDVGMEWSGSNTVSTEDEQEGTKEFFFETSVTVPKKTSLYCRAITYVGQFSGDFTTNVRVFTDAYPNQPIITYRTKGNADMTQWSDMKKICQLKPFDNMKTVP